MKLLYCPECGDIFNLAYEEKHCRCGGCGGHYLEDKLHAVYHGTGVPLGISNPSFTIAIEQQVLLNEEEQIPVEGARFEAFFIPANCMTFKKEST